MHVLLAAICLLAPDVQSVKHRVTGLFNPEREADLRETVKKLPDVSIVTIDFDTSEVTFSYDPVKLLGKGSEKQWLERFDNLVRNASSHTFGIRALSTIPKEKLTRIEIPVVGLDCRGCELSAYEVIHKMEGVEQATCSFKAGLMTALIDPDKTSKSALVEALKKRNVTVKTP
ncbi:MAG TPA: heavy-metal-associated domain-containing protein [Planctomycetota bacterium]|nr:heavy-metal-associated domain-containing protein [Planctomycetota bacterium]